MFIIFTCLIIGAVTIIAMQPNEFRVTRSSVIPAPANIVFDNVNNLRKWKAWSPWVRLDPNVNSTYEGPESGMGAILRWSGNRQVGVGSMEIIEIRPNEWIKFRLVFIEPMKATNMAEFSFKQEGNSTSTTWTTYGKNNFIGKAIGLLFNCEKIVGTQFENGLKNLSEIVETK